MTEEVQICSICKCNKLLKVTANTGKIYKTCISCSETFKCDFEECEYKCSSKGNLKRHIKIVHNKIKDFKCTLCEFKCSLNSHLKIHIKQVHDKIKDFECQECEFKFSTNSHLKQHIKQVHDKIKDFECQECEFKFSTKGNLKQHIKQVHNKIKDFKCNFCDFNSSLNSHLKQHIKQVHDKIKDFKCTLCEFKCSLNSHLKIHIKQVHDKIKDFECQECEFKFSTNSHLKSHIKQVHDKIKDFKCSLCQFKCSSSCNLKRHILICKGNDHSNMSGLELRTKEALITLGFDETDFLFNSSYSKLTDFCGRPLRPDFRFIHHKIMIECDGMQHSIPHSFGGYKEEAEDNFKKIQESDNIKNEFCEKYGYKMIRINYNEIKNVLEILHYELLDIIMF
jgi:KRAB domain-containing zinc finger protein